MNLCRADLVRTDLVRTALPSPLGTLALVASPAGLAAVLWKDEDGSRVGLAPLDAIPEAAADPLLGRAGRQLAAYLEGTLERFTIPLDLRGTSFQRRVWQALIDIPYGTTSTYGAIAAGLGCPAASRAVGAANGRNPLSIVVPCHRLVGSTGGLQGFAGGLAAKRWLIDLEAGRHRHGRAA
jgi:methylated-DNA-[protein]-cysteine S-methyltransferase